MADLPVTERRNPRTEDLDALDTLAILTKLNDEDSLVPAAVRSILPELAQVVEDAVERYRAGGSIHYFGAGASGRIGGLDAAELPPTFSVPNERIIAHIAGGTAAVSSSREEVEDDHDQGERDAADVAPDDIVFGLTASGTTPYVVGAISSSHSRGALCVVVSSNENPPLRAKCDHYLLIDTGPESLTGSTRMKAATAQKLVLNGFSTALMIRLGMTYSNLMVDVAQTNHKLRTRAVHILMQASEENEDVCRRHLEQSGGNVKVALLTLMGADSPASARAALDRAGGRVRLALDELQSDRPLEVP